MNARHRIRTACAAILITACLALGSPLSALAAAIPPPPVKVPSSVILTMDGTVVWSRRPSARRRVASTIKLLNALVVRDVADLDATVTVPRQASAIDNGDVGLRTGQKLTIRRLLEMMLVASANDAAEAIAVRVAGSEKAYVALMNAKAKSLGLANTHATDPHGLGKRETSTAADLTVLARRVMADPVLRAIVRKRSVVVPRPGHKTRTYRSTDLLLGRYAGIEGVKTGFTNPAGYCFIGAAKRGGVELMGVVLGATSNAGRFSEMRKLLDWGFAHVHAKTLVSRDVTMGVVPVDGGSASSVTVHAADAVTRALLDGTALDTTVSLSPTVTAPVSAGQRLGTVEVGRRGATLAVVPLLADADVARQAPELPYAPGAWLAVWP